MKKNNMGEWQPIETAPGGRDILVYCRICCRTYVARNLDKDTDISEWFFAFSPEDGIAFKVISPAYWMPLPELPEE